MSKTLVQRRLSFLGSSFCWFHVDSYFGHASLATTRLDLLVGLDLLVRSQEPKFLSTSLGRVRGEGVNTSGGR